MVQAAWLTFPIDRDSVDSRGHSDFMNVLTADCVSGKSVISCSRSSVGIMASAHCKIRRILRCEVF